MSASEQRIYRTVLGGLVVLGVVVTFALSPWGLAKPRRLSPDVPPAIGALAPK